MKTEKQIQNRIEYMKNLVTTLNPDQSWLRTKCNLERCVLNWVLSEKDTTRELPCVEDMLVERYPVVSSFPLYQGKQGAPCSECKHKLDKKLDKCNRCTPHLEDSFEVLVSEVSACPHCYCMTHTIDGLCGKCGKEKDEKEPS